MEEKKDRYLYGLDILRVFSTIAVLIYHINPDILPGGYLAVCVFLVLHGYLFVVSNERKENFSIISHFVKRIFRLYFPMAIVVCLTILGLRYAPDIIWLNEKPETMSVVECINNWWQIAAGDNYFVRVTASPFTHMWYISMLLQVELVLPFFYKFYRWLKKHVSFWALWVPFTLLAIASIGIMPYLGSHEATQMRIYFGTDARVFSILLGMALGFLHGNDKRITLKLFKGRFTTEFLFVDELVLLLAMCLAISSESPLYNYSFLASSLLTMLAISTCTNPEYHVYDSLRDPLPKLLGSITYEVYLTHYPLLFFAQALTDFKDLNIFYYVMAVLGASIVLHFATNIKIKKDWKVIALDVAKVTVLVPILITSTYGGIDLYYAKDHTEEMLELQRQLEENARIQQQLQEEYMANRQAEADLLSDPAKIAQETGVRNMFITFYGDSVMLGAASVLRETFPNSYVDAEVSRSHYPLYYFVKEESQKDAKHTKLGNPVVIGIGTNGTMPMKMLEDVIKMCGNRKIYWLTITNDWQFPNNATIRALGKKYDNVTVVDWEQYSKGHTNWFYSDGIHLPPTGRKAYVNYILNCISNDLIKDQMAEAREKRILGIGDGFLLTSMQYLQPKLEDCYGIISEDLNFDEVIEELQMLKDTDALATKAFITIGNSQTVTEEQLTALFTILDKTKIILVKIPVLKGNLTNENIDKVAPNFSNITVESWDNMYKEHPEYFAPDRIHFNDTGSHAFAEYLEGLLEQFK